MKACAVIVGMILTIGLYSVAMLCWAYFSPSGTTLPQGIPEGNLFGFLLFFFVYPGMILFLGSISTGVIIEPEVKGMSYLKSFFYSPGFYFILLGAIEVVYLISINSITTLVTGNHSIETIALGTFWSVMIPVILLLWIIASWAGVSLGYKIRSQFSGDEE